MAPDEHTCVFCLESTEAPLLKQICQCRASVGFVHAACMEQNLHYHRPVCGICKQPYHLHISDTTKLTESKLKQFWVVMSMCMFDEVIQPVHVPLFVAAVFTASTLCVWAVQGHLLKALLPLSESLELVLVMELYTRFGDSPKHTLIFAILFIAIYVARTPLQRVRASSTCWYIALALGMTYTLHIGWLCLFVLKCLTNEKDERPWPRMLGHFIPHTVLLLVSVVLVLKLVLFPLFLTWMPMTWVEIGLFGVRIAQAVDQVYREKLLDHVFAQAEETLTERNITIQPVVDDTLGVRVTRNNHGWMITHVSDGSLAHQAGICVSDMITSINKQSMADMTLQQWSAQKHQPGDHWTVIRDGHAEPVDIVL